MSDRRRSTRFIPLVTRSRLMLSRPPRIFNSESDIACLAPCARSVRCARYAAPKWRELRMRPDPIGSSQSGWILRGRMTEPQKLLCFSVVANVAAEVFGHAGSSAGTRHFSAGTKVYCEMPQWGDGGEKLWVVGRHRGSSRFIRIIMPAERLANWRVQGVYSVAVYDLLKATWPDRSRAEHFASSARARGKTTDNIQAAGKLVTRCYRQLDAGGPTVAQLEQEAATALTRFTVSDWKREPRGPAALRVLADWLEEHGAKLPTDDLASMVTRRVRRQEERDRRRKPGGLDGKR
jgi:hypothetical protein